MRVLAIDTAAQQCAVSVLMPDGTSASIAEPAMRGQPERVVPMMGEILQQAGLRYQDLSRIAVTTGPGSFTGLRVGLAAAKGLGFALSIPVIGIGSFSAFAASRPDSAAAIVIESRRDELYWRLATGEIGCGTAETIARHLPPGSLVMGDAAWRLAGHRPHLAIADQQPGPDTLAMAFLARTLDPAHYPADPVYVRAPDAVPLQP